MKIKGINLDKKGRCLHYHQTHDIVALKCNDCQQYYACYQCHDELEEHPFSPVSKNDESPILCGNCQQTLNYPQYQIGHCPLCQHPFNTNCQLHANIYFK
ncbi:CHY zinc finger protein [Vagococcus zengguangii]|uniref:Uncharacterized protein n=1 Tax=Vagococcus zengguangii TaxID=2571750 RepID=A0A4D7CZ96_9ENTE|nr:CHY zinc finger protein [Vagococcus zengguangii]QCI87110.1 hypothetical protein FA707_09215 [Vagococcus zengguangii]TLG78303.1 hypothetical protein FE258_09625 [Vagococcus zengguangii]